MLWLHIAWANLRYWIRTAPFEKKPTKEDDAFYADLVRWNKEDKAPRPVPLPHKRAKIYLTSDGRAVIKDRFGETEL